MQESGELHKLERSSFSSFSKQHEWPIGKQKACWNQSPGYDTQVISNGFRLLHFGTGARGASLSVRQCKETVKHTVRVRVESGEIARVVDPGDLRDFDSVVECFGRIVHKRVLARVQVVKESMLAGSRIAIIAHRDSAVVDAEDLRKDKGCTGFACNGRNGRINDRSTGELAVSRLKNVSCKTMILPVYAYIKAHNLPCLIDALGVDHVWAGGTIDSNETLAFVVAQEESGCLTNDGVLTYDVAVIVNSKGSRRRPSARNKRLQIAASQEKGIPVSIRTDQATGTIGSERHRLGAPIDVEKCNGSD